jgi:diguanylate cyclase (GGDEF)-like protein
MVYGLAHRTKFEATTGSTVPTEPVLVALLFAAPIASVPALVLAGLLLGGPWRDAPGCALHEFLVRAATGWYCAGPVAIVWAVGLHSPALDRWPVLLAALASQFLCDAVVALVRCWALKISARRLIEPLLFTFSVDSLLAPLAVCAVVVSRGGPAVLFFSLVPIAFVRVMAIDRTRRMNTAVQLGKELEHSRDESRTDAMTGLANRRAWEEAVAVTERATLERDERELTTVVLVADIDHLKMVNDSFGHEAGDDLLRAFASTLREAAPEGALVARLGGDEFGVLFQSTDGDARGSNEFVSRLRSGMAGCRIACGALLSASLGVASCPTAESIADAIRLADLSAGNDKDARRVQRESMASQLGNIVASLGVEDYALLGRGLGDEGRLRLLESVVGSRQRFAREFATSLRQAMDRKELFVLYQPLFSLEDQSVRGAEALVRWRDPERGVVLPGEFIPVAEETGLVSAIDAFVLEEACWQLARWSDDDYGPGSFTMAVNVSGRAISDAKLPGRVLSSIERNGLVPSQICLEITETALMGDSGHAEANLAELSGLGVHLALDDFGTRYSMLAHLQRLNVDTLKVDRSFVAEIGDSERDRTIVQCLTVMAHDLGMSVVGEGIETYQQLEELVKLGCDEGQGFLLAYPLPPDEFSTLRRTNQMTCLAH